MAKRAKTPVEINAEVKVKKTKVSVKKKDKKLDVVVDTPKVNVVLSSDEERKEFKYDGEKLDVTVTKTGEGTEVIIDAKNNVLKRWGTFMANVMKRKFNKK